MLIAKKLIACLLCGAIWIYAQGNTFTKVRYGGGSVASTVNARDWGNNLTITPEAIVLVLKDKQRIEIPPKSVTSLSYGQEAHRRVGTMVALAVLVAPVALFGLFHKTRLHFIGVQYQTTDDKSGGILLQGDKDNYRAILVGLQGVSGAPVVVGEKEKEFIPVGLTTTVAKDSAKGSLAESSKPRDQGLEARTVRKVEVQAESPVREAPGAVSAKSETAAPAPSATTSDAAEPQKQAIAAPVAAKTPPPQPDTSRSTPPAREAGPGSK